MRILLIFIFHISFWATSFAQKDISISTENKEKKFNMFLNIGLGNQTKQQFTYTQAIMFDYRIAPKVFLGTDFRISFFRNSFNLTLQEDVLNSAGDIIGFNQIKPINASYIQIPLRITYRPNKFQLSAGLSNNFLFNVKGDTFRFNNNFTNLNFFGTNNIRELVETFGFRKYHLRGHISAALALKLGIWVGFEFFQPLTNLALPASQIPSGNELFINEDQPSGFYLHVYYELPFSFFKVQ